MVEHLGNNHELARFAVEMKKEMDAHKDEKSSMRNWKLYKSLYQNNNPQILLRINKISELTDDYFVSFVAPEKGIEILDKMAKQHVHIANYAMLSWLKIQEEIKKMELQLK
jgi:hypothetical protein